MLILKPVDQKEEERVKEINKKFDEMLNRKRTDALEKLFQEAISTREALGDKE